MLVELLRTTDSKVDILAAHTIKVTVFRGYGVALRALLVAALLMI